MNKAQKYLEKMSDYLDDYNKAVIGELNDEQFTALKLATATYCSFYGEDALPGIDTRMRWTRATADDILEARNNVWEIPGKMVRVSVGLPAFTIINAQISRGESSWSMLVVDMGDFRVILGEFSASRPTKTYPYLRGILPENI